MLEKYVSGFLVKILSEYCENINAEQLNLSVWSGEGVISDLVLKNDALDVFDLPFTVTRAVCKKIVLKIPWRSLQSKPCIATIDELLISTDSPLSKPYDAQQEKERVLRVKQRIIDAFEAERQAKLKLEEAEKEQKGYVSRLQEVILNNLIVDIKAVHFRFEEEAMHLIAGAVLQDVKMETVDETGRVCFVEPSKCKEIRKTLSIGTIRAYTDSSLPSQKKNNNSYCSQIATDATQWVDFMRKQLQSAEHTVFGPVSGFVDLKMVFKKYIRQLETIPYLVAKAHLDNLTASLTHNQFSDLVTIASQWSTWSLKAPFTKYRPFNQTVHGNAKAWWKYAIHSAIDIVKQPKRAALLNYVSKALMPEYETLFSASLRKKPALTEAQQSRINTLKKAMTAKDMILVHRNVYRKISEELKELQHKKEIASPTETKPKKQGWISWMSGSQAQKTKEETDEEALKQIQQEFGISPDEDASDVPPIDIPPSYCWSDLSVDIPRAGVIATLDRNSVCQAFLQGTTARVKKFNKEGSLQLNFVTTDFTVTNPTGSQLQLPLLVQRAPTTSKDPLLSVAVDLHPVNQPDPNVTVDADGSVRLLPLLVVADPALLRTFKRFFHMPRTANFGELSRTTHNLASAISDSASTQLMSAAKGSITANFRFDAQAPIFIVPKSLCTDLDTTPAVSMTLGHLQCCIASEVKEGVPLPDYNRNECKLSGLSVVLCSSTSDALQKRGSGFRVLPDVTIDACVLTRTNPLAEEKEMLIVEAKASPMQLCMTLHQSYVVSQMLQSWRTQEDNHARQRKLLGLPSKR